MFHRRKKSLPDVFLVLLGAARSQESLKLAAVTGSEREAFDLLTVARRWFPERSNEVAQWTFESESERAPSRRASVGPGEKRLVFVLEFAHERYEVFDTAALASRGQQQALTEISGNPRPSTLLDVVTNTWVGEFSIIDHE